MEEMERWPDVSFNEDMIGRIGIIVHVPNKDDADELFDILKNLGVGWVGDGDTMDHTGWEVNKEETCYRISASKSMWRGNVQCYLDGGYVDYDKCTFYGAEPDFEISDTSFEGIVSTGGVF